MRNKFITGLAVASLMMPALASAQSTDAQNQIQALLSQIQALQTQLKTLVASTSVNMEWKWKTASSTGQMNPGQMSKVACITLSRNLRQGDQGDDVKKLQEMLMQDGESGFNGSATGFFGPMTMKAMAKFQTRMGIASSTDGSVGPMTRGFFERTCGKGLDGMKRMNYGQGMNSGPGNMQDMMKDLLGKVPGSDNMMFTVVRGTINASSASSITVQNENTTVTASITSSTMIKVFNGTSTLPTTGSVADLVVGKKAMIEGTKNADGTMQARAIVVGFDLPMLKMNIDGMKTEMQFDMRKLQEMMPQIPQMMMKLKMGGPNGSGSIVPGGEQ